MKKLYYLLIIVGILSACEKDPDGPTGPTGLDLKVTSLGNNEYKFENLETRVIAKWNFGNGQTAEGNTHTITYIFAGAYKVMATALISGIEIKDSLAVNVTGNREDLLANIINDTIYARLTGGLALTSGKTWVWDSTRAAHIGVGQPDMFWANWWSAPPKDKRGKGVYDDKLVFNIYNFKFSNLNNGDTYVKDYAAKALGDTIGHKEENGNDYVMPYTPPDFVNFTITRDANGNSFIEFPEMAFPSFYTGAPHKYQVIKITNDELYLRHLYNNELAWYFGFVREGFVPDLPPDKPYEVRDIHDNFEGTGNITWFNEASGWETVANPASDAVNGSANVAKYTRGTGNPYENVQIRLTHEMNLTTRNVFKVKVYLPSSNDYTTTLTKTLSLKLQDGDIGEPWTSQVEIKLDVAVLDQWVELTFDFSTFGDGTAINRQDLDRIVVQFGGEGHNAPGIFYIDDIVLQ